MYRNTSNAATPTNCQLIDKIKLPVHFFTTSITTIPVTIAITIDAIAIDVIAATDEEIQKYEMQIN